MRDARSSDSLCPSNPSLCHSSSTRLLRVQQPSAHEVQIGKRGPHLKSHTHTHTQSIAEIILCCFGHDRHPRPRSWFAALSADEQVRRRRFGHEFAPHLETFRRLPLSAARNFSVHRRGFPQYTFRVTGGFGTPYVGTALQPVPLSEAKQFNDPRRQVMFGKPRALEPPSSSDFAIDGRPLYPECDLYLKSASALVTKAREIAERIHANAPLTLPPQ